jgi:hypothetical protein
MKPDARQEITPMANLDRAGIIELLGRLGAEHDAAVVQAARELHQKVSDSGLSWDDLLRGQADFADAAALRDDQPLESAPADDTPRGKEGGLSAADRAEAARVIDRLLARKNLSNTLREDLADFKRMLADGSFEAMDNRYLRALAKRLGS